MSPRQSSPFSSDVLTVETADSVATLWLDRPEQRNAMGPDLWEDLPKALTSISDDPAIRAVIIAARGPHFTVGLDLKSLAEFGGILSGDGPGNESIGTDDQAASPPRARSMASRAAMARREVLRLQASINAVADCPLPVIAAVHGYCIGGGVDLITACDIRLASADAVFSVRETKMAMVADLGSLQRLPAIIGKGHVAELAFTGQDIDAKRAATIGLVNNVYDDAASTVAAALELAKSIAGNSPLAVQGTKAVLRACEDRSIAEGLDYVATWNAGALASDDLTEAMTAFLEKRPAKFTGR